MTWIFSFELDVGNNVQYSVDLMWSVRDAHLLMIGSVVYDHTVFPTIIELI